MGWQAGSRVAFPEPVCRIGYFAADLGAARGHVAYVRPRPSSGRALAAVHGMVGRDGRCRLRAARLAGTNVLESSSDELLRWVLLRLPDGRQLLLAERTDRDGTKVLVEPTKEELQAARLEPWAAWNSERAEHFAGIDDLRLEALGR